MKNVFLRILIYIGEKSNKFMQDRKHIHHKSYFVFLHV